MKPGIVCGKVRPTARNVTNPFPVSHRDFDAGSDNSPLARGHVTRDGKPGTSWRVVAEQRRRLVEMGQQKIQIAIIVVVSHGQAPTGLEQRETGAGVLGRVDEPGLPHVLEQDIPRRTGPPHDGR